MSTNTPETSVAAGQACPAEPAGDFSLDVEERSIGDAVTGWVNRLRYRRPGRAAVGARPDRPRRRSSCRSATASCRRYNIGNLPGQGAYIAIIALGLVFVLLLGEIDLSAGTAGGICAAHRRARRSSPATCTRALPGAALLEPHRRAA